MNFLANFGVLLFLLVACGRMETSSLQEALSTKIEVTLYQVIAVDKFYIIASGGKAYKISCTHQRGISDIVAGFGIPNQVGIVAEINEIELEQRGLDYKEQPELKCNDEASQLMYLRDDEKQRDVYFLKFYDIAFSQKLFEIGCRGLIEALGKKTNDFVSLNSKHNRDSEGKNGIYDIHCHSGQEAKLPRQPVWKQTPGESEVDLFLGQRDGKFTFAAIDPNGQDKIVYETTDVSFLDLEKGDVLTIKPNVSLALEPKEYQLDVTAKIGPLVSEKKTIKFVVHPLSFEAYNQLLKAKKRLKDAEKAKEKLLATENEAEVALHLSNLRSAFKQSITLIDLVLAEFGDHTQNKFIIEAWKLRENAFIAFQDLSR